MQRVSNLFKSIWVRGSPSVTVAATQLTSVDPSHQTAVNLESRRYGRRYRRWHHWPNDFLPFHWERTKQDPPYLRTGDAVRDIGYWDPGALVPGAEYSKELANAPPEVRKQFTLEFAERPTIIEHQRRKIVNVVQRHPFDRLSPEVRIAEYTVKIRNNLHHFTKVDKYDAPRKIRQGKLVDRRNMLLNELYRLDRERYDRIVRTLGITHTAPQLGVIPIKPTRKAELRRLTKEYCEKIKEEKLERYHEELKAKQALLEEEFQKVEQLVKDEKYLGTQPTNKS